MAELIGNTKIIDALRRAVHAGRGQTFILEGPERIGKATIARAIAGEALKTDRLDSHAEFFEMVPDPELTTNALGIWSARQAKQFLQLKSAGRLRRIVFVEHAERLTTQAQNALLKMLEEPPREALILLVVTHADDLLQTIRSRSLRLRFRLVPDSEIFAMLADLGAGRERAEEICQLAHGRPGLAKSLFEDTAMREALSRRASAVLQLADAPLITRLAYSAKAEAQAPEALPELPMQWLPVLRDTLRSGNKDAQALAERLFSAIEQLHASPSRPELVLDAALIGD